LVRLSARKYLSGGCDHTTGGSLKSTKISYHNLLNPSPEPTAACPCDGSVDFALKRDVTCNP
jgi:hypothetical protein